MAKKLVKNDTNGDGVITPDEIKEVEDTEEVTDNVEDTEETEDSEVASVDENTEPLVKIKTSREVNCYIGNVWYRIPSNTEEKVPKNVKEILNKAGYLLPL